jgi:hypothetical protein
MSALLRACHRGAIEASVESRYVVPVIEADPFLDDFESDENNCFIDPDFSPENTWSMLVNARLLLPLALRILDDTRPDMMMLLLKKMRYGMSVVECDDNLESERVRESQRERDRERVERIAKKKVLASASDFHFDLFYIFSLQNLCLKQQHY